MAALLPGDALTLCCAALLIGLWKGGIGGPLPTMLATLMISQRVSVATAVALAVPMLMVGDVFALYTYWGTTGICRHAWALIPAGAVGVGDRPVPAARAARPGHVASASASPAWW